MARDKAGERDRSGERVRDLEPEGDLGEAGHSAFGKGHDQGHQHNDERLAGRGRNPAREDSSFLDPAADEATDDPSGTPGRVRGLNPPDKEDVGG